MLLGIAPSRHLLSCEGLQQTNKLQVQVILCASEKSVPSLGSGPVLWMLGTDVKTFETEKEIPTDFSILPSFFLSRPKPSQK